MLRMKSSFWSFCFLAIISYIFFFQAEDGIRDPLVTGVQSVLFRSEGESGRRGITLLAQERMELFDRPVQIAHVVEGESQAFPGLDQLRLEAERLAQLHRGRCHVALPDRRPTEPEVLARLRPPRLEGVHRGGLPGSSAWAGGRRASDLDDGDQQEGSNGAFQVGPPRANSS